MSEPPVAAIGIRCEECGTTEFRVLETSHAEEGILRLRECRVCGSRIRTIETILSSHPPGRGWLRGSYPPLAKA